MLCIANRVIGWTKRVSRVIVRTSVFGICLLVASVGAQAPEEERVTAPDSEGAESESKEQNASAEQDIKEWRQRYATLYLENRRLRGELQELKRIAAAVLGDKNLNIEQGKSSATKELLRFRKKQKKLHARLQAFRTYLETIFNVMEPSAPLRKAVLQKHNALLEESRNLLEKPSPVAKRGGDRQAPDSCEIIAKDDDVNSVVFNAGKTHGIAVGSKWRLPVARSSSDKEITMQAVETQRHVTAAVVIEGDVAHVQIGGIVHRVYDDETSP